MEAEKTQFAHKPITHAWLFDGSAESVQEALSSYPELRFVWRAEGKSFINWRSPRGDRHLMPGKYLVRFEDGTFGTRFRRVVRRDMAHPIQAVLRKPPLDVREENPGGVGWSAPAGDMVAAWVFDGTPESVADALGRHEHLHLVRHPEGNYLLWEAGGFRRRVRVGHCLVEYAGGLLAKRQIRVARRAGLVP